MSRRTAIFLGVAIISLTLGILHASSLSFVNDDAFISFRYAKNFVRGLGLVYNVGERVEGFTNFLWTMLMALGIRLGIDPVNFSTNIGILFHASTLALFGFLSWRLRPSSANIVLPMTMICLSVHRDFSVYATSGLETSMYTCLLSGAFVAVIVGRSSASALLLSGMLISLATMTRPDGALFGFAIASYLLLTQPFPLKKVSVFSVPVILFFFPYWFWRWNYYGFFFPNTFYAKSVDVPYYSQGLAYIGTYFITYYVFLLAIPLLLLMLWRLGKQRESILTIMRSDADFMQPLVLALLFVAAQTLFILRVGGDFMFARFFIPVTPFLFLALELLGTRLMPQVQGLLFHLLIVGATIFRINLYSDRKMYGYIADEYQWYTKEHLENARRTGEKLRTYFDGLPVGIAFWGEGARLAYYSDVPLAIEAAAGLTDSTIAHQILGARGRPGHEKKPTLEYLYRRKVHFLFAPPEAGFAVTIVDKISFGDLDGRILIYDNAIMSKLGRYPEITFLKASDGIDAYLSNIDTMPADIVKRDYDHLKRYYFQHNDDREREQRFIDRLAHDGLR